MPDSRRARRLADPGLQPERTALAWLRTLLGYGALLLLALRNSLPQISPLVGSTLAILALVLFVMWRYVQQRRVMNVAVNDFYTPRALYTRLAIALAVFALALLFTLSHLRAILALL